MDYKTLRFWWKHKHAVFTGHNGADGTTSDNSTDPVITRDPNNYLVPRIDGNSVYRISITIAAILAVIVLAPMALKTLKSI
jgi:hypothetical protein